MENESGKFDYEKRIADAAQIEFRTHIDGTSVISTVVPDTSRKWMLITSARIEKRKAGEHL